jgi:hypothetical protein
MASSKAMSIVNHKLLRRRKMKIKTKLTAVALAALVGVAAPSWGMEQSSKVETFDDNGLTNLNIKTVIENRPGQFTVKIEGKREGNPEFHRIAPSATRIFWENDDVNHRSEEKVEAIVDLTSGNELYGYLVLQSIGYTKQKGPDETMEGSWFPIGATRTKYSITEWKRRDDTLFIDKQVLCTQTLQEITRHALDPLYSQRGQLNTRTYQGGVCRKPGGTETTRYTQNMTDQTHIDVNVITVYADGRREVTQDFIIKLENARERGGDYPEPGVGFHQLDFTNKYWRSGF